jgi:hypothetical protein
MTYFRHRLLREWESKDRRRFKALLGMPIPDISAMCSECQAPILWHEYNISLRLFQPAPSPGSQAEKLARLMPGWWERCPACTAYKIGHVWGGTHALPNFTGEQWIAMLPPLLRTLAAWRRVSELIATTKPREYDTAVQLLVDLRNFAERDDGTAAHRQRSAEMRAAHARNQAWSTRSRRRTSPPPLRRAHGAATDNGRSLHLASAEAGAVEAVDQTGLADVLHT